MKKILETLKRKWTEYLLEIIVIVVGILGAYSLNNWNELRKLRAESVYIINELQAEFDRNLEELNRVKTINSNVLLQFDSLLDIIHLLEFPGDEDKLSEYLLDNTAYRIVSYNPSQGMINSLVSASNFQHIKNLELRRLLLNWSGYFGDYKEDELMIYNNRTQFRAFLSGHINQHQLSKINSREGEPITNILDLSNRLELYRLHMFRLDNESRILVTIMEEILKLIEQEIKD